MSMGAKRDRVETQITLGAKTRFVQLPVSNADKGLGTGRLHGLVPLWLQKGGWCPRRAASAANDAQPAHLV